jgi:hypothetical protein
VALDDPSPHLGPPPAPADLRNRIVLHTARAQGVLDDFGHLFGPPSVDDNGTHDGDDTGND